MCSSEPARGSRRKRVDPQPMVSVPDPPGNRGSEAPETSQREILWPIRWSWPKRQGRRRRSGTRRPWTSVRAERSRNRERELAVEAMNGRRGAGRSDADRLPTRKKPSQGKAHRVIPRTVRGGPESKGFGAPTNAEGPTWRTPDLVPAATCWRPGTEQAVEVVETTRTERVGRVASTDRSGVNERAVATRSDTGTERERTFPERPGRGARRRTKSSRRGRTEVEKSAEVERIRPERRRRRNG